MASGERQRVEMILGNMTDSRFKSNVCRPAYKRNERLNNFEETDFPPKEVYEPLGWDREPGVSTEKHYRKFYEDELETVEEIMSTPSEFDQYMLKKGQSRGAASGGMLGGLFGGAKVDESGAASDEKEVGKFKALITISQKGDEERKARLKSGKLGRIIQLVNEIHTKRFGKASDIGPGFFGETGDVEEAMATSLLSS